MKGNDTLFGQKASVTLMVCLCVDKFKKSPRSRCKLPPQRRLGGLQRIRTKVGEVLQMCLVVNPNSNRSPSVFLRKPDERPARDQYSLAALTICSSTAPRVRV